MFNIGLGAVKEVSLKWVYDQNLVRKFVNDRYYFYRRNGARKDS